MELRTSLPTTACVCAIHCTTHVIYPYTAYEVRAGEHAAGGLSAAWCKAAASCCTYPDAAWRHSRPLNPTDSMTPGPHRAHHSITHRARHCQWSAARHTGHITVSHSQLRVPEPAGERIADRFPSEILRLAPYTYDAVSSFSGACTPVRDASAKPRPAGELVQLAAVVTSSHSSVCLL